MRGWGWGGRDGVAGSGLIERHREWCLILPQSGLEIIIYCYAIGLSHSLSLGSLEQKGCFDLY